MKQLTRSELKKNIRTFLNLMKVIRQCICFSFAAENLDFVLEKELESEQINFFLKIELLLLMDSGNQINYTEQLLINADLKMTEKFEQKYAESIIDTTGTDVDG